MSQYLIPTLSERLRRYIRRQLLRDVIGGTIIMVAWIVLGVLMMAGGRS